MASIANWEMLQNALQSSGESALRRRALQQQQEAEMNRIALQQQLAQTADARNEALQAHYDEMLKGVTGRNEALQTSADAKKTAAESTAALNTIKGKNLDNKMWYVTAEDGSSHDIYGTGEDAIEALQKQQSANPDQKFQIYDKPQAGTSEVTFPDGTKGHLKDEAKAKYEANMARVNAITANANKPSKSGAYDTIIQKTPAQPADITPGSNGFHGWGAHDAITNSPAIPEQTIVRRVPHGTQPLNYPPVPASTTPSVANPSVIPAPTLPQAKSTPAQPIRVQHPNGKFGFIPPEQLQDALTQGYKLAPLTPQ